MSSIVSDKHWDEVVTKLQCDGVATVDLPREFEDVHARSFATSRQALDKARASLGGEDDASSSVVMIPVGADSAHATGYHSAGGSNSLSRYNSHREGFVFSDDETFGMLAVPGFNQDMMDISNSLHVIANHVLAAMERQLDIPNGWFQQALGPMNTSSQFHVKRYVHDAGGDPSPSDNNDPQILLPIHTDPSVISVIIHDVEGKNPSAMGLQCHLRDDVVGARRWQEVPFHGHAVAVVFVGSVLSYMTGNVFPSIKHRVVKSGDPNERIAATLFVRPQLKSTLKVPPSQQLNEVRLRKKSTFGEWISRVSRNYSKAQKKQNTKKTPAD